MGLDNHGPPEYLPRDAFAALRAELDAAAKRFFICVAGLAGRSAAACAGRARRPVR